MTGHGLPPKPVVVGISGDCWIWTGARNWRGYGRVTINKKLYSLHRIIWRAAYGAIPLGGQVLHSCDNPSCVNPTHLFIGSQTDNMRDAAQKKRLASQIRPELRRGESNGNARLNKQQVAQIRESYRRGIIGYPTLAERFGVGMSTIRDIIKGRTWSEK
jgi:hypothetical protein